MVYNSRTNKDTPMTIQQLIEQLSSAVVTNGNSIIKIVELINRQDKKIVELQKELQELKSKLK